MTVEQDEYERRKRAIFDSMSERGRKRILRIGYENWDPFQEPKDPRERLFSRVSLQANSLLQEFFRSQMRGAEHAEDFQKDLFELCSGLLRGETKAQIIFDFCCWMKDRERKS